MRKERGRVSGLKLTKRDQALQDNREIRTWKADANGIECETMEIDHVTANHDSNMLLEKALKRARTGYRERLQLQCARPLPGFGKVTTQQLRNADVELLVSEKVQAWH